jgi:hypothetical protein
MMLIREFNLEVQYNVDALFCCYDFSHSHRGFSPVPEHAYEVVNRFNGFHPYTDLGNRKTVSAKEVF